MRLFMMLLLLLPITASAQINRSASALARENIEAYLTRKVFRYEPYRASQFGTLQPASMADREIAWTMDHRFLIQEKGKNEGAAWKAYSFVFYFDKRMKILMTRGSW